MDHLHTPCRPHTQVQYPRLSFLSEDCCLNHTKVPKKKNLNKVSGEASGGRKKNNKCENALE